jgi:hypothetical protein
MLNGVLATPHNDRAVFDDLCETLRRGNAIGFAGAGLSARAGFADWNGFLERLWKLSPERADARRRSVADPDDLPWKAEQIRMRIEQRDYEGVLKRYFRKPRREDPGVQAFARLPLRHVFTTNYDDSLERAMRRAKPPRDWGRRAWKPEIIDWSDRERVSRLMGSFPDGRAVQRCLIHLHGRWNRPSGIVLTERDYRERYVRSDETQKQLFAVFAMQPALFVGFSLRDLDVMAVFREVNAVHGGARHYAVLPADPCRQDLEDLRDRYRAKYGVHTLFYLPGDPRPDDRHPNFVTLMEELANRSASRGRAPRRKTRGESFSGKRWTQTPQFRTGRGKRDPEDPQKGRFGGLSKRNGLELKATVSADDEAKDWFKIELAVTPTTARRRFTGTVGFWVHDSFSREYYTVRVHDRTARLHLYSYGAFTVGAVADGGRTPLELDLARLRSAPLEFRLS